MIGTGRGAGRTDRGEGLIGPDQLTTEAAELVADARYRGQVVTQEQAEEMILGPLRRARDARLAAERAAAWARSVVNSWPLRTPYRTLDVIAARPANITAPQAAAALGDLVSQHAVIMRGSGNDATLTRRI